MNIRMRYARSSDIENIINVLAKYNMHHIPSPEMPELDYRFFFVAEDSDKLVGAAGYKIISPEKAKTTLMAVLPEYRGSGIGEKLQLIRMQAAKSLGCEILITNADRPETINWYKKKFAYKEVGRLKKLHSFGLDDVDEWTTLETDLSKVELPPTKQNKLIINAALTGMVPTKTDNPHVPITPEEIADDAYNVYREGASIVHIHARDQSGNPTTDRKVFAKIISGIREKAPDLIICATTSGRICQDLSARADVLHLHPELLPDMASLTCGSFNFPKQASINEPQVIMHLANSMIKHGVLPELEIFEVGMLEYVLHLIAKGILQLPMYINLFFGSLGTMRAKREHLEYLRNLLPIDTVWAAAGIGVYQDQVESMAMELGGGVRTGLEDSIWTNGSKEKLATNQCLVARVAEKATRQGIPIASPKEVRTMLALDRSYGGGWGLIE